MDGQDRTAHFMNGAYSASFHTMQQNVPHGFRPTSILQQVVPSGIGLSNADQSRRLYGGGLLPSVNGASPQTWEQRTYLETPFRSV